MKEKRVAETGWQAPRAGEGGIRAVGWRQRLVEPEVLDGLDAGDQRAICCRRDLQRINRLMGNYRWFVSALNRLGLERAEVIELGSGDGELGRRLSAAYPGLRATGFDLTGRPATWPSRFEWIQGDLRETLRGFPVEGKFIVANMVFHHFPEAELKDVSGLLTRCEGILASEPWRHRLFAGLGMLLRLTGISADTWHDLRVSVRAGFRGNELPDCLGIPEQWIERRVSRTWLGACRLTARRRGGPR
ncbi:MAG TPA: class I SAM-dependent methyltransferase [Verrucomicrobiales bacterium]|nr:class I SAM-dependent methyltransferase [Verrucomicrobiales bacterium]